MITDSIDDDGLTQGTGRLARRQARIKRAAWLDAHADGILNGTDGPQVVRDACHDGHPHAGGLKSAKRAQRRLTDKNNSALLDPSECLAVGRRKRCQAICS